MTDLQWLVLGLVVVVSAAAGLGAWRRSRRRGSVLARRAVGGSK